MAYANISKPSLHFNNKLYTGTSVSNAITGVGFQPDLVWLKDRTAANWHCVMDAVRGASKVIYPNDTSVEATVATLLTSFDSDGFTVGTSGDGNTNTNDYVSWNWKANGAGSLNEVGSINSTVSVNTTSGVSIVSYTGDGGTSATIGHGLGAKPKMIITKGRTYASSWATQHQAFGANYWFQLCETDAAAASTTIWNDTEPTDTVFTVGSSNQTNDAYTYMAYCFADIKGFSKFGQIEGNLNADGPFVYTGFKPAFLLLKNGDNSASGDEWFMEDAARSPYNPTGKKLSANIPNAETTGSWVDIDFLSNGFKIRTNDAGFNEHTMMYMAFASEPLVANVGSSIPATAR